jgi:hypothetical protein
VGGPLAHGSELRLRSPDILDHCDLVHEVLVHVDIEENRGAPTLLRQNDGTLGCQDLFEGGRGMRPEFSDVTSWHSILYLSSPHGTSCASPILDRPVKKQLALPLLSLYTPFLD